MHYHGGCRLKLYTNALIVTNDHEGGIIPGGCIGIDRGRIVYVGSEKFAPPVAFERKVDLGGKVVLPGMIVAHTHLYSFLARGLSPAGASSNFVEQLEKMWWRLDFALDLEDVYWSAIGGALSALLCGTTTLLDHHASPSCIRGSLEAIARAYGEVGIRGALAYEITDRNGEAGAAEGLEENKRGLESAKENPEFLAARTGLHASFTLSDKTLDAVSEKLGDAGVHIHVAEDRFDVEQARRKYGEGVIERLAKRGLLNKSSILAHGVHLCEEELEAVADSGAFLIHNPMSNMNNGVGVVDLSTCDRLGVKLAIGTDGMGPDPAPDIKTALILQRHKHCNPSVAWGLVERMYCDGNSEIATRIFGVELGRLRIGSAADFVVRNYDPPTPITKENWWGHFLFGLSAAPVDRVLVGGKELVSNGEATSIDTDRVWRSCRERARKLWQRW